MYGFVIIVFMVTSFHCIILMQISYASKAKAKAKAKAKIKAKPVVKDPNKSNSFRPFK